MSDVKDALADQAASSERPRDHEPVRPDPRRRGRRQPARQRTEGRLRGDAGRRHLAGRPVRRRHHARAAWPATRSRNTGSRPRDRTRSIRVRRQSRSSPRAAPTKFTATSSGRTATTSPACARGSVRTASSTPPQYIRNEYGISAGGPDHQGTRRSGLSPTKARQNVRRDSRKRLCRRTRCGTATSANAIDAEQRADHHLQSVHHDGRTARAIRSRKHHSSEPASSPSHATMKGVSATPYQRRQSRISSRTSRLLPDHAGRRHVHGQRAITSSRRRTPCRQFHAVSCGRGVSSAASTDSRRRAARSGRNRPPGLEGLHRRSHAGTASSLRPS